MLQITVSDKTLKRIIIDYVKANGMVSKYSIFVRCKVGYDRFNKLSVSLESNGLEKLQIGNQFFWVYNGKRNSRKF